MRSEQYLHNTVFLLQFDIVGIVLGGLSCIFCVNFKLKFNDGKKYPQKHHYTLQDA